MGVKINWRALVALTVLSVSLGAQAQDGRYVVGAGLADSTGEVAENTMFGYADDKQVSTGLQQRMHARAFTLTDGQTGKGVLLVVVDAGAISQAIHQQVLRQLAARYGGRFTEQNVMISATHTHSGPGGFSHYTLYGLTTEGFQRGTYQGMIDGILRAVDRAVASEAPADIRFGRSQLTNASAQRSATAFARNPVAERAAFAGQIDADMAVLRFERGGKAFGAVSFFAVHPTSLTSKNTLVSGDNKGYAAYYWEKLMQGTQYRGGKGFVGAFANTNAGDMTANLHLHPGSGPTEDEWENARIIGERQAQAAISTPMALSVSGPIDSRQKYFDMSRVQVRADFTPDRQPHTTCPAAYKSAFAAGSTEDGGGGDALVSMGLVGEGRSNPLIAALGTMLFYPSADLVRCHGHKEVAIAMGTAQPFPWSPEVLPAQVVRLGQLALVAMPGEFTIAAGRRIRQTVAERLGLPLSQVLFMGYTNAYAGYNTTPEEYDQQDYEGASTHFGPYTVPAWQQNVAELADALRSGNQLANPLVPRDLSAYQVSLRAGVVFDDVPLGKRFGQVEVQPKSIYRRGEVATAVFWTGHPKNDLRQEDSFLEVQQRQPDGSWLTVRDDNDWDTVYYWKRVFVAWSQATVSWAIGPQVAPGTYRFVHKGNWKNGWTGAIAPLSGTTQAFQVR
ncbi:neutral/alkaline ceramidase [Ottowia testudinis]|uniref:Neutral ceramidase n=1 Tax=Ottowia testudinis TaxID=2816950 RepID=A0A975CHI1_9BURK|nr:neutral/alkaline ceramidase [Ottowia testudinis]QTD46300.1 neutral/alkaline ceramidase [Ottowia testudinis]